MKTEEIRELIDFFNDDGLCAIDVGLSYYTEDDEALKLLSVEGIRWFNTADCLERLLKMEEFVEKVSTDTSMTWRQLEREANQIKETP